MLFLLFPSFLSAQALTFSSAADLGRLEGVITEPFVLTNLAYQSDVVFAQDEFLYVVDLPVGKAMGVNQIAKGIRHLFEKNKFELITLHIEPEEGGKALNFELEGWWTFDKLKISGVWVNKDWYKQYYLMESGDPFDPQKHNHSVQRIKELSRQDGFFNVHTNTTCDFDDDTKSVRVNLALHRGARFAIDKVDLQVKGDLDGAEKKRMQDQLTKKFARPLHRTKYAKTMLKEQAQALKKYLAYCGYLHVSIKLTEKINYEASKVNLSWYVEIHKKKSFVFFGNSFFS
jgi:hypothetical protein